MTGLSATWRESRDHIAAADIVVVPRQGDAMAIGSSESRTSGMWLPDKKVCTSQAELTGALAEIAKTVERAGGRTALDDELKGGVWLAALEALDNPMFCSASYLLDTVRMQKDEAEIELLRQAGELTDNAIRQSLSRIRQGVTMRELQLEIEFQGRRLGASGVSFQPVSGFIAESAGPTGTIFSYGPDEGLRVDTTIFFDVGFVLDGYCSDWGRSVYFGSPPTEEANAYAALGNAVVDAVKSIRPGHTKACDVYDLIEKPLGQTGFDEYIRARLKSKSVGHQIGIEVHENPWLEPGYDEVLKPGMVMCFEPKLWKDGSFYLRVEDMVLITEHAAEFLTKFDRRLFALP